MDTTSDLRVRDASDADAAAIAAIGADGFADSYAEILTRAVIDAVIEQTYSCSAVAGCIGRCIAADNAEFLVAERGGRIAGFLHFDSEGREPELHRIYVDRTQIGGGVGSQLMAELRRRLDERVAYILMVLKPNTAAIRFYERHGLRIERETDAVAHYSENMGFSSPDTRPVPALIMRYRPRRLQG